MFVCFSPQLLSFSRRTFYGVFGKAISANTSHSFTHSLLFNTSSNQNIRDHQQSPITDTEPRTLTHIRHWADNRKATEEPKRLSATSQTGQDSDSTVTSLQRQPNGREARDALRRRRGDRRPETSSRHRRSWEQQRGPGTADPPRALRFGAATAGPARKRPGLSAAPLTCPVLSCRSASRTASCPHRSPWRLSPHPQPRVLSRLTAPTHALRVHSPQFPSPETGLSAAILGPGNNGVPHSPPEEALRTQPTRSESTAGWVGSAQWQGGRVGRWGGPSGQSPAGGGALRPAHNGGRLRGWLGSFVVFCGR